MVLSGFPLAIADHVALHDSARVLREIETKRRILARHQLSPVVGDPELPWGNRDDCQFDGNDWPAATGWTWPCPTQTIRSIASSGCRTRCAGLPF
ncbi:DUF6221 family protein [Streptomyces sp900116325]|uniref:DUF6221 family protein n=1 Tax=Streptomyces sp. 900116325 TaxID=3154295 RepID=UPI0033AC16D3